MERLTALYPALEFHLVVGLDLVPTLPKWVRAEALLRDVRFVVAGRPGSTTPGSPSCWPAHYRFLQYQGGCLRADGPSDCRCVEGGHCLCTCRCVAAPPGVRCAHSCCPWPSCGGGCGCEARGAGSGGGGCCSCCSCCAGHGSGCCISSTSSDGGGGGRGCGGTAAPPDPRFRFSTSTAGIKVVALSDGATLHTREAPSDLPVLATLVSSSEIRDRLGSVDPAAASRAITGLVAVMLCRASCHVRAPCPTASLSHFALPTLCRFDDCKRYCVNCAWVAEGGGDEPCAVWAVWQRRSPHHFLVNRVFVCRANGCGVPLVAWC